MTDMRRTLLWVVFSMSLVLIWDAWSRHNGQTSFRFAIAFSRLRNQVSVWSSCSVAAWKRAVHTRIQKVSTKRRSIGLSSAGLNV